MVLMINGVPTVSDPDVGRRDHGSRPAENSRVFLLSSSETRFTSDDGSRNYIAPTPNRNQQRLRFANFRHVQNSSPPAVSRPLGKWLRRIAVAYFSIAVLLGWLIFEAVNPGGLTNDSLFQLQQAQGVIPYNDWHPVIMSWNWSLLIWATGSVASMAGIQLVFAVIASMLTVYYLLRLTRNAWIGTLGLFPVVMPNTVNMWGMVWKDTQMALALYIALMCILLIRHRPRIAWLLCSAATFALVYGTIVRKNSALAIIPLIMLLCLQLARRHGHRFPLRRLALFSVAGFVGVCLLVMAGSAALNGALQPTRNSQVDQVMLDDLIFAVPQSSIDASSTAPLRLKNKIAVAKEKCAEKHEIWNAYWTCYGRGANGQFTAIADSSELRDLWIEEIPRHIPEYLNYRRETTQEFLFTSTLQISNPEVSARHGYPLKHPILNERLQEYVMGFGVEQMGILYRGWFALVLCSAGLVISVVKRFRNVYAALIFSSGILYILSFIPAAPAANYRYVFWTMLAGMMGFLVLLAERLWSRARDSDN